MKLFGIERKSSAIGAAWLLALATTGCASGGDVKDAGGDAKADATTDSSTGGGVGTGGAVSTGGETGSGGLGTGGGVGTGGAATGGGTAGSGVGGAATGGGTAGSGVGGAAGAQACIVPGLGGASGTLPIFSTSWTFDSDLQAWTASGSTAVHDPQDGSPGSPNLGSAKLALPFTAANQQFALAQNFAAPMNLTGQTLTARVRLKSCNATGSVQAFLSIKSTALYIFARSALTTLDVANGWVTLSYDLAAPDFIDMSHLDTGGAVIPQNLADVREIDVAFLAAGAGPFTAADVNVDTVGLSVTAGTGGTGGGGGGGVAGSAGGGGAGGGGTAGAGGNAGAGGGAGAGGVAAEHCSGCARLAIPTVTTTNTGTIFQIDLGAPTNLSAASITYRVCVFAGALDPYVVKPFAQDGPPNFANNFGYVPVSGISTCANGFTNVVFPVVNTDPTNPYPGTITRTIGIQLTTIFSSPGPWSGPSVIYVDSITSNSASAGPFTFDASFAPFSINSFMQLGGAEDLSWVGP